MKIVYFDRTSGACDYYRAILPLTTLAKQNPEHKVATLTRADVMVAIESDDNTAISKLLETDIIVIPRLAGTKFFNLMKSMNPRAKIILEYDDNLFKVSPLSPHYADHGIEDVTVELPDGKLIDVWKDGVNIDLAKNKRVQDEIIEVLGRADAVTVTTNILADAYKSFTKNIIPLPNCVDFNKWQRLPLLPHKGLRMGWFGGSSHYEDWCLLSEVLPNVMEQYPHLKLVLMGTKFEGTLKKIPKDRIEFHPWEETPAYPYKAAILDLDFAIIPLRDNEFNRCKSAIKWIEMGALRVPSVTSYVSPYKELATEDNGVWIDSNDPKSWVEGIALMVENEKQRFLIGDSAYQTVLDKFDISKKWVLWESAYKEVLDGVTSFAHST